MPLTFVGCEPVLSWEMWHPHFGHVAYSGLWKLLDKKLVDGFHVDKHSPTPDCVVCTEAKQHVKPFPKVLNRNTKPGELTHIEYVTLPHLFRSDSGLSGRNYRNLRNPVDYFFVCTVPL